MRPILIDTNAYAAFKKGNAEIIEIVHYAEVIGISPIMLGELFSGFEGGNKSKQNREELQKFLESPRIKNYIITSDTAQFFSQIYSVLKRKGRPIPTNDMWIAAQALEHGCVLCTYDKHFDAIEGLLSGNTMAELSIQ
jgi:tRNA(fMet)-specific endonuclease VapC